MKPAPFTYHAPATVADAVALLSRFAAEDGRIMEQLLGTIGQGGLPPMDDDPGGRRPGQ